MSLQETYAIKCGDLCIEPLDAISRALHEVDSSPGAGVLRLNGNSKNLFHSRIGHVQLVALCEALRGDTGIEFLDVSFNDATPAARHGDITAATFGDEAAQVLARLLKASSSMRCVSLEGNAVAQQGAEHLATALGSGCLEVLNLASNPIGDKGAMALAEALKSNATLRMLDIGGCSVGVDGFLAITASLAHDNAALECLSLEDCRIASPPQELTTRSLANMCKSNSTLRQLYLGKQQLSDEAFECAANPAASRAAACVQYIVDHGLLHNSALELLDLRANHLSGMCAGALSRLLLGSSSITTLNLAANRIGDEGAAAIAAALPATRTLALLDLRSCGISDAGMCALAHAVPVATALGKLSVWGNVFGPAAAAAWRDVAVHVQEAQRALHMDIEPYEVDGEAMIALSNEGEHDGDDSFGG